MRLLGGSQDVEQGLHGGDPSDGGGLECHYMLLGNETTRGVRLPASIEHTAYSGYFFLHLLSQKFGKSASD